MKKLIAIVMLLLPILVSKVSQQKDEDKILFARQMGGVGTMV